MMQVMTLKAMTFGTLCHFKNYRIFPQIMYQIVLYTQEFLPMKFFSSFTVKTLASGYLKMYCEPMK